MASVRNATRRLLHQLLTLGPEKGRRRALSLARRLAAQLQASADAAAVNASHLISRGTTVITCSYSSAVIRAVQHAQQSGKAPVPTILEPADDDASHGARLARELRAAGVEARLVDSLAGDSAVDRSDLGPGGSRRHHADVLRQRFADPRLGPHHQRSYPSLRGGGYHEALSGGLRRAGVRPGPPDAGRRHRHRARHHGANRRGGPRRLSLGGPG